MREIQLSRGYVAIVDDDDFERVGAFKWTFFPAGRSRYAYRKKDRKNLFLHRFILDAPAGIEVDHVNSDGLDNRRANLRLATRIEQQRNMRMHRDNASGFKGVCRRDDLNGWQATICHNGKNRYLGIFQTAPEAAAAYDRAARELHGEFARTNA